ncbi:MULTISPECIES: pilus assembly protein TadG-related protein [unclassified Aureimonas]|uniref:pilus assembly protein TadG-related protein n=1 Tax=unclassified Aureimonas TaxID=2615206 RepID=UPI0012E3639A|nr:MULTISPECIES: pilus assembly protein TadG-related protein [unclassified Aureimonas]
MGLRTSTRFVDSKGGSISIAAAIFFCVMVLVAALAIESSNLYLVKLQTQRASDLASLAAAATPQPLSGTTPSATAVAAAAHLAELNGMGAGRTQTVGRATDGGSGTALVTTIHRDVPLQLGNLLSRDPSVTVDSQSWAVVQNTPIGDCARSLLGPVNIYGNASVFGPNCRLGAATYFYACGNAAITLLGVSVKYTAPWEKLYICDSAKMAPALSSFTFGATSTDPLSSDSRVAAIRKRFVAMRNPGWPYGRISPRKLLTPSVSTGPDQTYGPGSQIVSASAQLGKLTAAGSLITFEGSKGADPGCAKPTSFSGVTELSGTTRLVLASGCYVFGGTVSTKAGADVIFDIKPRAVVTLVFKGDLVHSGASLVIGNATVSITGNIDNSKGGIFRFGNGEIVAGAGVFNGSGTLGFGTGPFYFNGGSISNGEGAMTFGDGAFYLWGGSMSNASTGTMTFGDGPFIFYGGTVTNVAGTMTFGRGPFEFQGGGLILDPRSEKSFGVGDIKMYGGSVAFNGKSVKLGVGGSAVEGGSSIFLSGGSLSLSAGDMTAIGTTIALDGGTISLYGTGTITATAPTGKAPAYGYRDMLFVVFGGAFNLYQSAAHTNTMAGISYVPKTNSSIYGKQIVKRPAKGCLEFLSGVLDIYQDASLDLAPCSSSAESTSDVSLYR